MSNVVVSVPALGVRARARVNGASVTLSRSRDVLATGGPLVGTGGLGLATVVDGETWELVPVPGAWRKRTVLSVTGDGVAVGDAVLRWLPGVAAFVVDADDGAVLVGPLLGARVTLLGRRFSIEGDGVSLSAVLPEPKGCGKCGPSAP